MEEQLNKKNDIDAYLGHLEDLSSRIADNISLGHFKDITKLDIERKFIINKISKEASNLNDRRKSRLKLVWVNNNKWGINMFCNGSMILPSQLMDPPPIPIQEIKYMFETELDELNCVGDSEIYGKFFKMKKMRVPIQAIKNKMELEGLDGSIIELKPATPLSKAIE